MTESPTTKNSSLLERQEQLASVTPANNADSTKADQIQAMFDGISGSYDLLNDCISFGMHRFWKRKACALLNLKQGDAVLDVASGTGDLLGYLSPLVGKNGRVTGLDFSAEMLAVAEKRFQQLENVDYIQGDALKLPFEDNTFDGAIISFGLRNVTDIPKAIAEMRRVVKPNGWVVNLDSNPEPSIPFFWFYFSLIMPVVGKVFSMDQSAYEYLAKSTKHFLTPAQLKAVFEDAGLHQVTSSTMTLGAASLQAGQK